MLKQRIMTGVGMALIVILVLLLSHIPWVITAVTVILSGMSALELCRAADCLKDKAFTLCTLAAAILIPLIMVQQLAPICLFVAMLGGVWLMRQVGRRKELPKWIILLVVCISAACWGLLPFLRKQNHGFFLLTMVILIPVITDIGAYCFGRTLGKHKLAPVISPKKTWEGSVGGTLCAVVLLSLAALLLEQYGWIQVKLPGLLIYLMAASCISQLGDLTFSSVKRIVGIKDYGTLLPGHGGILDRFDSLLPVIPFTVWTMQRFGSLIVSMN